MCLLWVDVEHGRNLYLSFIKYVKWEKSFRIKMNFRILKQIELKVKVFNKSK